jgi:hypothetical protein
MRIRTHIYLSFGLSMLFLQHYGDTFQTTLLTLIPFYRHFRYDVIAMSAVSCLFFAWAINAWIDGAGHGVLIRRNFVKVTRSWATHNLFTAPFWGAAIPFAMAASVTLLLELFVVRASFSFAILSKVGVITVWLAIVGALIGLEHLAVDALTPFGVYYTKTRRFHLASWKWDGMLVNYSFFLIGLGFAAYAVYLWVR